MSDGFPVRRRTMLRLSAGAGLLYGGSIGATGQEVGTFASGPERSTSETVESKRVGPADEPLDVLLIKDCEPWDVPANEMALDQLGYTYQVLTSDDAAQRLGSDVNIDDFDTVLIPTTQSTEYYQTINSIWSTIEGFADDGGTLIIHGGEKGWPCGSEEELLQFPGSVESVYNFEITGEFTLELQELTVVDSSHPSVEGLSSADLSYWASDISSFGYFSGLPSDGTNVVGLRIDPEAHPTYIEYPFGSGRVLATMMGPEWAFGENRKGTTEFLLNEIEYAIETDPNPGPEPQPDQGVLLGTVRTSEGTPAPETDVYLIDPLSQYQLIDSLFGETPLPTPVAQTSTNDDGEFVFDVVEPGRYLLAVEPEAPYDSTYTRVPVPADETTSVSLTVEADRHLGELDSEFDRIRSAVKANARASTDDVAEVYVDGANFFSNALGVTDYASIILGAVNTALSLKLPGEKAFTAATEIKSFLVGEGSVMVAEHGLHLVITEQWEEVNGTRYQNELVSYTQTCLDTSLLSDPDPSLTVPQARTRFSNTQIYQETTSAVDEQFNRYDTDLAYREPSEEFSIGEVKSALETQARWLEGNGIASGIAITPSGNSYGTREARYHSDHYHGLRFKYDAAEIGNLVASGISAASKAAVIWGPVGLAAGTAVSAAGNLSSLALSMYQVNLENKIGDAWVKSATYWVSDLYDAQYVTRDLVDWLRDELKNPSLGSVDGTVDGMDLGGVNIFGTTYALANKPDYPEWWGVELPKLQLQRVATNTVSVTNTGSTTADARIIAVDTYGDGKNSSVSDAVKFVPGPDRPDEELIQLSPGESHDIEHEYVSDFHPFNPFNWHHMSVTLWMDGQYVDEQEQPYYVVPNLDLIPGPLEYDGQRLPSGDDEQTRDFLRQPLQTDSYVMTDGSKSAGVPLDVEDWTEYVGEIDPLIQSEISPDDPTVSTSVTVEDGTAGIVFVLGTTPDAEMNLHVRDESGNHVGYDPSIDDDAVEIPSAEYNGHESTIEVVSIEEAQGTYDVEVNAVSFTRDAPMSVSLYSIDIPERDGVLTVSPGTVGNLLQEGETATSVIEVGETGNQVGIEVTDIQLGAFTTRDGNPLSDVAVTISTNQLEISPGSREEVELRYDAASSVSLPEGPETRFEAPMRIQTSDAGVAEITASVLLLDTDVDDARLTDATADIEGVTFSSVARDQLPSEPNSDGEFVAAYEIDAVGSGEAAVAVPFGSLEEPAAYTLEDGRWLERDSFVGEDLVIRFEVPADGLTVAVAEAREGPPPIGDFENPPTDPDGDGLYEDINGDGEFDIVDVQALFANLDDPVVQNNPEAFDFNGDGEVDVVDVQRLFNMLS